MPGFIAFAPVGRSYRIKDPLFIPDKDIAFLGGWSWDNYKKGNMFSLTLWLQMGGFRYYNEDNKLKGADDNEGLTYLAYGHSFFKRGKMYAFSGLGMHVYEIAAVRVENGKTVVDNYNRKTDIRPSFVAGVKGGVNNRLGYEYNFCSSKRVRHQVTMDVKLGRDDVITPTEEDNKTGFDFNRSRFYLHFGGGFDERKAYNLFFGIKLDFVRLDTISKR
jgi:hypothetical protein